MRRNRVTGFTLIELLISITILITLTTIGFTTYQNSQIFSRDARRKQDLKTIQTALEVYYYNNKHYPLYTHFDVCATDDVNCAIKGDWENSADGHDPWIDNIDPTDSKLPLDPLNQDNGYIFYNTWLYFYKTTSYLTSCLPEGQWYALKTNLENANDPDTASKRYAAGKPIIWCDGTVLKGDGSNFIYDHTYVIVENN